MSVAWQSRNIRSGLFIMRIQGLEPWYVARMKVARAGGVWGTVLAHPSAILLVVQLLGVLLYPYMEETGPGAVLFEIFGAVVLALAIWSVRESPGPTWIAVSLAVANVNRGIACYEHTVRSRHPA